METKFIFMHIFKTGGTTLRYTLMERYGRRFINDTTYRRERKRGGIVKLVENTTIFPPKYKSYDIIFGHFTCEKYKHLGRPIVTILRDPVSRFISHYSNAIRRKSKGVTFENFCERSSNIMTHFTNGDLDQFEFVGLTEHYVETMKKFSKLFGFSLVTKKKINKTKKKETLTKGQIALVKEYNREDIKLYAEALKRFKNG